MPGALQSPTLHPITLVTATVGLLSLVSTLNCLPGALSSQCIITKLQQNSKVTGKFGKYCELIAFYNIHFSFNNLSGYLSQPTRLLTVTVITIGVASS